jgi:predicted SPOUT superfamily RNA methylase MTH1
MYSGTEMTTSAKSSITLTIEEAETETPDDTNKDENKDPSTAEHEHSWKENTSKSEAATCTEDGYKYYECTVTDCTETKKETVKAAGHKYGDWKVTKEATVSAEGEETRTCSVCNEKETRVIAKLQETNTNDESNNTANNILSQGNSTDTTTAKTVLPNTGIKTIILPAILLIIVAYVSYNKYIKYKDI